MSTTRQTAISKGEHRSIVPTLFRGAGLSAVAAGIIFTVIQPIHPADVVASVTTIEWAIITPIKTVMCFLFLAGITGIYARQAGKAGWLGLAGFLLFSLSWWLQTAYVFAETFIFPLLASTNPQFVDGLLAFVSGRPGVSGVDLGALPALYSLLSVFYMLGGLVLGIATYRARVLPRAAAVVLAVAALLTPLAALLPHNIQRFAAIPVGLAVALLGLALLTERRSNSVQSTAEISNSQPQATVAG